MTQEICRTASSNSRKWYFYCFSKFLWPPFRLYYFAGMIFFPYIIIFFFFLQLLQTLCVTLESKSPEIHNFKPLYISWSSNFAFYLENHLMYKTQTLWLWVSMTTFDLKINVGPCDLHFMVQWFCIVSPRLVDGWVSYFLIMRHCDPNFELKINIGQHDLYFMV